MATQITDTLSFFMKVAEPSVRFLGLRIQAIEAINDNIALFIKTNDSNVFANDLIAFWRFEEESGVRFDSSWNELDLTDINGPSFTSSGKIGNAATFLRSRSHHFRLLNANLKNIQTQNSFTLACWVQIATLGDASIASLWDTANDDREFLLMHEDGENSFDFKVSSDGEIETKVSTTSTLLTNTWYHLIGIYDKSNQEIKIYLNGVLEGTTSFTGTINNGGTDFGVGSSLVGTTQNLGGAIDAMGIWSRVLNDRDIGLLYNDGNGLEFTPIPNFLPLFIKAPEPLNNNINLYTEGMIEENNNINLFIKTIEEININMTLFVEGFIEENNNLTLFIKTPEPLNDNFPLFLESFIDSINNNLSLFINNLSETNTLKIFIEGRGDNVIYDFPTPINSTLSDDFLPIAGNPTLFLQGDLEIENNFYLFLKVIEEEINTNIEFFVNGAILDNSSMNLVIPNTHDVINNNPNLYIHGATN